MRPTIYDKDIPYYVKSYIEAAVWADLPEDDEEQTFEFIDLKSLTQSKSDCDTFIQLAGNDLAKLDLNSIAHDFWLTRNHHGAGFWDGDYEKGLGERLTKLSHTFKELTVFIEDNTLYIE